MRLTARDDGWLWRRETGDGARERFFALSSELQPVFGGTLSDELLLRRAALRPLSQKRVEVLRVGPEAAEPSHVIIDRLDDGSGPARYRLTDDEGLERELLG